MAQSETSGISEGLRIAIPAIIITIVLYGITVASYAGLVLTDSLGVLLVISVLWTAFLIIVMFLALANIVEGPSISP